MKNTLPSLFRAIDERLARDMEEGDQAYLNAQLLKLEFVTKVVVASVVSCLEAEPDRHRYGLEYRLIRANSLGEWVQVLQSALVGPPAQFLLHDASNVVRNLTKSVPSSDWRYSAVNDLNCAAKELGVETTPLPAKVPLRNFFNLGVQIRNRTRGHGAPTTSHCAKACPFFEKSLSAVVNNAELFRRQWVYLHRNLSGKYRVTSLMNSTLSFDILKSSTDYRFENGVYFALQDEDSIVVTQPVHVPLIYSDPDVLDIRLPNGNYHPLKKYFEVLSYVTNSTESQDASAWSIPPDRLPDSETEGGNILEKIGNTFTNTPPGSTDYISRNDPEDHLLVELNKSDHHPIISLTGPGGVGKTSIAIAAIEAISKADSPAFDVIMWISARDIDLLESGPKPVTRRVYTEKDISEVAVELLNPTEKGQSNFDAKNFFQGCLSDGTAGTTLFVLDNFETLSNPTETFDWLDTFVRLPNKVLITTRFRDFRGDYPIEIHGMSEDEANNLINHHAGRLGIQNLITQRHRDTLISESGGHPYVLKILLAEISNTKRVSKPLKVLASVDDVLNALFQRTFQNLTPAGQRTFLLLSSWRVPVPEIAVEAVAMGSKTNERYDVSEALDELYRFSLVERFESSEDNFTFLQVPLAATIFGNKELEVSPFSFEVSEDRKLLMEFGPGQRSMSHQRVYPRIEKFFRYIAKQANDGKYELGEVKPILEFLATKIPEAYLLLVDLYMEFEFSEECVSESKYFIKRYIQTNPNTIEKANAWRRLIDLCKLSNDVIGEFHALGSLARLLSGDHLELAEVATSINSRIRELKGDRKESEWTDEIRTIISSVVDIFEMHLSNLSATHCSRLAWLYLNLGNVDRAQDIVNIGLNREPNNEYCNSLSQTLVIS